MEIKEKIVEDAFEAIDVYEGLKELTAEDDICMRHGLFKIEEVYNEEGLKDDGAMKVSYIEEGELDKLTEGEVNYLRFFDGWHKYYDDYSICKDLLNYYNGL